MEEKYVERLEVTVDDLMDKNETLALSLEEVKKNDKSTRDYFKNVIGYLVSELEDSDREKMWETLQSISKIEKTNIKRKPVTQNGTLVYSYLCKRLEATI
jgi:hypoxanthine phosphoribosyltransferase